MKKLIFQLKNCFYSIKTTRLWRNATASVIANLLNVTVSLISYPVFLDYLGFELYGLWLILGIIITFINLGNLGIAPAIMKLVSGNYARNEFENIADYFVSALFILLNVSVVLFAFSMLFQDLIISGLHVPRGKTLLVHRFFPYIVLLSLFLITSKVVNSFLSGVGRMDKANFVISLGRIIHLTVAVLFLKKGFGIVSLIWSNFSAQLLVLLLSLFLLQKHVPIRVLLKGKIKLIKIKDILSIGLKVCGGSVVSLLFHPMNKLLVSYFLGLESVPIYELAFQASMQIRNMIEVGFRALLPEIGYMGSKNFIEKKVQIKTLFKKIQHLFVFCFAPFYIAVFVFAPLLLQLWLGANYSTELLNTFRVIFIGTFFSLVGVPYFYTLLGLGWAGSIFLSFCIQSIISFLGIIFYFLVVGKISILIVAIMVALGMLFSSIFLMLRLSNFMNVIHLE